MIIIVGLITFGNGLFNEFIGDDYGQIVDNVTVHSLQGIFSAFGVSTFYSAGMIFGTYYKPFMQIYFTLIYTIFGPNPFWFHLFQLFFHIANAVLLFLLFKKVFFREKVALSLALIFLVHPINSESVFSIAATQEVLYFFFGMLALLVLSRPTLSTKNLILAATLLFGALLSKETGILFVFASLSYMFFFRKEKLLAWIKFLTIPLALYFILKHYAVGIAPNPNNSPIDRLDLLQRMYNIPAIIWFYIKTFFFPVSLSNSYHWAYSTISLRHFFLPLILDFSILAPIAYFGVRIHKHFSSQFPKYLFFLSLLIVGLGLHMQIIPLDFTVSERWFYFPIIGILGIIGILFENFTKEHQKKSFFFFLCILLILLSGKVITRSFDWRDQTRLAYQSIEVSPDDYSSLRYIASDLLRKGDMSKAKEYANQSIAIFPSGPNYTILGLIYMKEERYEEAKSAYLTGIQNAENYYPLYSNYAGLSLLYGKPEENIVFIQNALTRFPQAPRLWSILAVLEYRQGNVEDAKKSISEAYKYDQSANTTYIYNTILQNKPLDIRTRSDVDNN